VGRPRWLRLAASQAHEDDAKEDAKCFGVGHDSNAR
jgi:hypothetical protein